jgi:hypothetical protein
MTITKMNQKGIPTSPIQKMGCGELAAEAEATAAAHKRRQQPLHIRKQVEATCDTESRQPSSAGSSVKNASESYGFLVHQASSRNAEAAPLPGRQDVE